MTKRVANKKGKPSKNKGPANAERKRPTPTIVPPIELPGLHQPTKESEPVELSWWAKKWAFVKKALSRVGAKWS